MAVSLASVPLLVKKLLVRLPPGVMPATRFGERDLRLIREDRRDMLQLGHLLGDFLIHCFVAMAHADGDDAAEEIQVLIAVGVPNELIFGAFDDQGFLEIMEHAGE